MAFVDRSWCAWGLAALCACLALPAWGLEPAKRFAHYVKDVWSIDQGLPQITVRAITQDAEGYIWVGTQAGVARFDGLRFQGFDPNNTPALPGMLTQALTTGPDGTVWIGTYKGLARYRDRKFTAVPASGAEIDVAAVAIAKDGDVFAAGPSGLFEVVGDTLVRVPEAPAVSVTSLHIHDGVLWLGAEGGAYRRGVDGFEFYALPAAGDRGTVSGLESIGNQLYAGTSHGLYRLDGGSLVRFEPTRLPAIAIDALFADRDLNLWVHATDQLLRIREGRIVEQIPDASEGAHRAVRTMYEDREGSLWVGSQWEGLARYWNGWTRRHSVDEGLLDPIVWSVARDPSGGVWVGGNDGLSHFESGAFRQVLPGSALPHPNAYTLLAEADRLWIGTRRGIATLTGDRLERPSAFADLANAQINGFLRDRAGVLWIASVTGLYRYDQGALTRLGEAQGLTDPRVRLLHETASGRLLVATQAGLFEHRDGRLTPVGLDAGLPAGLDITALHELPSGDLLLGTLAERLFQFADGRWFEFNASHGLPANSAFFLTSDRYGWVWVAGIRGVYRVPLRELDAVRQGAVPRVATAQMLISERGDQRGSQKGFCCNGAGNAKGFLAGDTLWLPTRGGVVTVSSPGVTFNPLPPPVSIERLRNAGRWQPLEAQSLVTLPLGERDVAFEFTALSFQQPASVLVEYRLRGFDDDWHASGDPRRRDASYTNLPPGTFDLEVRGSNNAGVANPRLAVTRIVVPAYFHETTSFLVLLGVCALAFMGLVHGWTTRHLRARQVALELQVAQRTKDLAQANARLEDLTQTDVLTGLRNRRYLQVQLPADLSFYLREVRKPGNEGSVMMLALVDLDHFKQVNDTYGHHAGDKVLQQVARLLEVQVRTGDYVVRWGGEEFVVVCRPMPWQEATKIAERLRRAIATHPFEVGGPTPVHLTGSIGFVEYPLFRDKPAMPDWERMVELADRALYVIKQGGRNGWATFRPAYPMRVEDVLAELDDARLRPHTNSDRVHLHRSPVTGGANTGDR